MSGSSLSELLDAVSGDAAVRAQTAAFALVTAYDFDVSEVEIGRFVELMLEHTAGSPGDLGRAFAALAEAMKNDPERAASFTRDVIVEVKDDDAVAAKVARAARAAAAADVSLDRGEEHAMAIIGIALGRDVGL